MKKLSSRLLDLGRQHPELRPHLREILAALSKQAKPIALDNRDLLLLAEMVAGVYKDLKPFYSGIFTLQDKDPSYRRYGIYPSLEGRQNTKGEIEITLKALSMLDHSDEGIYEDQEVYTKTVKVPAQDLDEADSHTQEDLVKAYLPDTLKAVQDLRKDFKSKIKGLFDKEQKRLLKKAEKRMDEVEKIVKREDFKILNRETKDGEVKLLVSLGDFDGEVWEAESYLNRKIQDKRLAHVNSLNPDSDDPMWMISTMG